MRKGHILVVEDDDSIRHLLMEYLKEHSGVAVDGARDGVDALHQVSTKHYDVVVLDVMMPHMTGIDFLDSLKVLTSSQSEKHLDELPAVIVITSAPQEQIPTSEIQDRFAWVVRAVLRKPIDTCELARFVDALLAQPSS
jgi:CheY-like chemotaxis protein